MKILVKAFCTGLFVMQLVGCAGSPDRTEPTIYVDNKIQAHSTSKAEKNRKKVLETIQEMIGVRYKYGGSTPKGFDCSGLVWYSHKQAGIHIPRTAKLQMKSVNIIRTNKMRPGDLLFFKTGRGNSYHVGTYVGAGQFVHAPSSGKRVSTTRLDMPYWKQRLKHVGNFYPAQHLKQ